MPKTTHFNGENAPCTICKIYPSVFFAENWLTRKTLCFYYTKTIKTLSLLSIFIKIINSISCFEINESKNNDSCRI